MQRHQFGEVIVGADQVADDVALGGDDVYGWHFDRPAVTDDVVRAGPLRQVPSVLLSALLANEVEYDLGAFTVGHLQDLVYVGAVGDDGLVGAEPLGHVQSLL